MHIYLFISKNKEKVQWKPVLVKLSLWHTFQTVKNKWK